MKNWHIALLAAAIAFQATSHVHGSLQVGTKVKLDTSLPGGVGGQFGVIDPGNPAGKGFDYFVTFCAEITETINNNGQYYVNAISAVGNSTGKTLGPQAAFLYTQFRSGAIGPLTDALSNGLQYGIWLGMGYDHTAVTAAIGPAAANSYEDSWNANKGVIGISGWLEHFDDWSGIGDVRVMQLGDSINGPANRQDQLVLVPEFSTIAIWSVLGAIGGAAAYRKRTA